MGKIHTNMKTLSYLLVAALLGLASYSHATSVTLHSAFPDGAYTSVNVNFDNLPSDVSDITFVVDNVPWSSNELARKIGAPHYVFGVLRGTALDGNVLPTALADWDDEIVQVFYCPANIHRPWALTGLHDLDIEVFSASLGVEHFDLQYNVGVHTPDGGASAGLLALATGGLILMRRRH